MLSSRSPRPRAAAPPRPFVEFQGCRIVQDVPPLPVGIVPGGEVAKGGMLVIDQCTYDHWIPVEHNRVPEMAGEVRFASFTLFRN